MNKFTLHLRDSNKASGAKFVDICRDIMKLDRAYQSMHVSLRHSSDEQSAINSFIELTARHGAQVRNLSLHAIEFRNVDDLYEILSHLPLLEEFDVKDVKLNLSFDELLQIKPVILNNLRSLCLCADWNVLRYLIGATSIKSFEVLDSEEKTVEEISVLVSFLTAAKSLESLRIEERSPKYENSLLKIFQADLSVDFKLTTFHCFLHLSDANNCAMKKNFTKFAHFIKSQASSIEFLDINFATQEVYSVVLTHLNHLKKLKLHATCLPTDEHFYDELKPIWGLRDLRICENFPNEAAFEGVFGNLPNLESLYVTSNEWTSKCITFLAANNKKLEVLKIDWIEVQLDPGDLFEFKHLKLFYLTVIRDFQVLLLFLRNNPSIETFGVRLIRENFPVNQIFDVLVNMPHLRHLKFGGKAKEMKAIFDKIVTAKEKFESLELIFGKDFSSPRIMFKFPEDASSYWAKKPEKPSSGFNGPLVPDF